MAGTKQVSASGKRRPPAAGRGRKAGSQNKITRQLKEMILGALDDAGGQAYLLQQAHDEPKAFMALLGRVLPMQVANSDEGEFVVKTIVRRVVDAKPRD